MIDLEAARQSLASRRKAALARGVAESTLRGWEKRARGEQPHDPVRAFFETPAGIALLHRMLTAALFVIVLLGGNGAALVRTFFSLCGLDALLACSERHLQGRVQTMVAATGDWGDAERARLAATMPARSIGLCVDETFRDGMLLVGQEPVSNFLLVEKRAERRDAHTWHAAVSEGLKGLPVTVAQVTSDEAEGLLTLARTHLGVQHNADVFHGQHEVARGVFGPLRSKLRAAQGALDAARRAQDKIMAAYAKWKAAPRRPGRAPNWDAKLAAATDAVAAAEGCLHEHLAHKASLREAIRDLGEAVSPIDRRTGTWWTPTTMRATLHGIFEEIWQRAAELSLPERTVTAITKAERLVEVWVSSVTWWNTQVDARLHSADLPPALEVLMRTVLIPAAVLDKARRRAPTGMLRRAFSALIAKVRAPLDEEQGVWLSLSTDLRRRAAAIAVECAALFQSSSSGVEGRNGYLSLRHHHLHALPAPWLKALTVIHNFAIRRDDGTTAAERFFGEKPRDLFEHLVAVSPRPARPRTRQRARAPDLFAEAA